jgi:hypothetical protein
MLQIGNLRSILGLAALLAALSLTGCGGVSADEAMYKGNEEATQEHMKEIDDEEQSHFAEVQRTAPPEASGGGEVDPGAAEEARMRQ